MLILNETVGKIVGSINITVCETNDGMNFFDVQGNTEKILPVLDVVEDTLFMY